MDLSTVTNGGGRRVLFRQTTKTKYTHGKFIYLNKEETQKDEIYRWIEGQMRGRHMHTSLL